jgi:hypothetical protein
VLVPLGEKMTDTFREIEKGHEAKFKLDEELRFKVQSRRNKLFGLWAAEQLGLSGHDADEYARSLIRLGLERAGHDDVVAKVLDDLGASGLDAGEREAYAAFADSQATALEQIAQAYPTPLDSDHVQVGG